MDQGLATAIGMTIAYAASLLGLLLAWRAYRRHHRQPTKSTTDDTRRHA